MMTNLFSIFDPSTSNGFSMNWISIFTFWLLMPKIYFKSKSRANFLLNSLMEFIIKDLMKLFKNTNIKFIIIFINFFVIISFMNFLGLFPYIFTPTSHLSISLSFALPFWIAFMLKGWLTSYSHMLTHLVPMNTPLVLIPFMVLIETISNIIRPITLSIRLTANMIAGHLLITLLSSTLSFNIINSSLPSMALTMLSILEMSVTIIQSYVFTILLSIYLNEI